MDLGFFTGKNDLAKFLAIAGLFAFIFSLMYPLEKKKELELEIAGLNPIVASLNDQCADIQKKFTPLSHERDSLKGILDTMSDSMSILGIKEQINAHSDEATLLLSEIKIKNLEIKIKDEKIVVLNKYVLEYENYLWWLYWVGALSMLIGFISWGISGYKEHNSDN
ncbi:MAG: hypothetical protein QNK23_02900 [Crocinitomicaceae bacterium]|nr:hypothetical protein [Crocinitomicaceae bacterium]